MASSGQPSLLPVPDGVDLWWIGLDALPIAMARLAEWLQADEQRRAAKFRRGIDRRRFVAGRGLLRAILARYNGVEPGALRFVYGLHGKSALAFSAQPAPIHFNLAHTDNLALLAVALRPVGVDVEMVRPLPDLDELIAHYFAPSEQQALSALDGAARLAAFYRVWTRKEAWLKLGGEGLMRDPAQIAVTCDDPARLLWVNGAAQPADSWSLVHLDLPPVSSAQSAAGDEESVVGALAVKGSTPRITWHSAADLSA